MTNVLVRADGSTEIGSSSILSFEYTEQCNTSEDVTFGCAVASCISVEVLGALSSAVSAGEELIYYQVDDSNTRTLVGKFYVSKPTIATKNSYKFDAYDSISKLDKNLSDWLYTLNNTTPSPFPYTLKNFAIAVCTQCGLTFSTSSFLNDSYSVKAFYADNLTGRDLMEMVAELGGGFLKADTSGNIIISWYASNTSVDIAPQKTGAATGVTRIPYFIGALSFENYTTALVERVQIHSDESDVGVIYPSSATGVTYEISNNILLTNGTTSAITTVAQNLYNRISTFTYKPFQVRTTRNGLIHAGDILTVYDSNNTSFSTIAMKVVLASDGLTVSSTGTQSRDSTSGVALRKFENVLGQMLTLEMGVEGLKVEASTLDGRLTTCEVNANKINWLVQSGTSASNFTITSRLISLVSDEIDLTGYVKFTNLSTEGSTTINAGNITTGTLTGVIVKSKTELETVGSYTYYGVAALALGGVQFHILRTSSAITVDNNVGMISPIYDSTESDYTEALQICTYEGYKLILKSAENLYIHVDTGNVIDIGNKDDDSVAVNVGTTEGISRIYGSIVKIVADELHIRINNDYGSVGDVLCSGGSNNSCYWDSI